MEYIKQSFNFKIEEPTVLSLGKFDGLHRGHELLMRYMAEKKTALDGLKAVVFTFDVPPQGKLHKTRPQVLRMPIYRGNTLHGARGFYP